MKGRKRVREWEEGKLTREKEKERERERREIQKQKKGDRVEEKGKEWRKGKTQKEKKGGRVVGEKSLADCISFKLIIILGCFLAVSLT